MFKICSMHNCHQTEEPYEISTLIQAPKTAKREGVSQLFMAANANQIQHLCFLPKMTDPLPCPVCGHKFVRKIRSQAVLRANKEGSTRQGSVVYGLAEQGTIRARKITSHWKGNGTAVLLHLFSAPRQLQLCHWPVQRC